MVAPIPPSPNPTQFSLRTVFFVTAAFAVLCAIAAPYVRELPAETLRWYGLLGANFALPAVAGVLFARLRMRRMARRAGRLVYSVSGQLNMGQRIAPLILLVVFTGLPLIAATNLVWFFPESLVNFDPMLAAKVATSIHINIGLCSALAAMQFAWWRRSRVTGVLQLHEHGVVVGGVWFFAWKRLTGYRWREAPPEQLSVWLPSGRLKLTTDGTCREAINTVFETHGVWGTTEPR